MWLVWVLVSSPPLPSPTVSLPVVESFLTLEAAGNGVLLEACDELENGFAPPVAIGVWG